MKIHLLMGGGAKSHHKCTGELGWDESTSVLGSPLGEKNTYVTVTLKIASSVHISLLGLDLCI